MIISVKIRQYLKEFLISWYKSHPIKPKTNDFLGSLLAIVLETPKEGQIIKSSDDDLFIEIPNYRYLDRNHNFYISERNMLNFEHVTRHFFDELFYLFIEDRIKLGFQKKDCILQFCYLYQIPLDKLNYEMLKKKYYRYQKAKKIEKNTSLFVPYLSQKFNVKNIRI